MKPGKIDPQTLAIVSICVIGIALLAFVTLKNKPQETVVLPQKVERNALARVNGDPIYAQDLEQISSAENDGAEPDDLSQMALLINQRLLAEQAKARTLDQDPDIEAEIRQAQDSILARHYIDQLMAEELTDEKLRQLYDSQARIRQRGIEVRARQILLPDLETAKEVVKKLAGNDSFQSLAVAYSLDRVSRESGGDLGYFTRDSYPPEFADPVFAMEIGTTSDPFETSRGWHIVEVSERRQAPSPDFDEIKDELAEFLKAKIIETRLSELREQANIEILTSDAAE